MNGDWSWLHYPLIVFVCCIMVVVVGATCLFTWALWRGIREIQEQKCDKP